MLDRRPIGVGLAVALLSLPPGLAAAEFSRCQDITVFLGDSQVTGQPQFIDRLKDALRFIQNLHSSDASKCDDRLIDRVRFNLALAHHRRSESYADGSAASRSARINWASEAAGLYEQYLKWVLDLSPARRDRMIAELIGWDATEIDTPQFERRRRNWFRQRLGAGALNSIINTLDAAGRRDEIVGKLEEFYTNYASVDIFCTDCIAQWERWLRTLPDHKVDRDDSQVRELIGSSTKIEGHWRLFFQFLEDLIRVDDSYGSRWTPTRSQLRDWLPQSV